MIRVLGDRVLVALPPKETSQEDATGYSYQTEQVSDGGIILAKPVDAYNIEIATRGIVVQVGHKRGAVNLETAIGCVTTYGTDIAGLLRALRRLEPAPFEVSVGDCVLFAPGVGEQIDSDGVSYVILHEDQVLARVEPLEVNAA
jgi:co-chaperonin GroES (HSP10)